MRHFRRIRWDFLPNPCKNKGHSRTCAHTHTQNKIITRHRLFSSKTACGFIDVRLTASSVWASLDRCHPALSKSCSAKPFQSEKTQLFTTAFRGKSLKQLLRKGLLRSKNIAKNYAGTHRRTREFSPEKVKEDIWWMLLFSRILHQKEKRIKSLSLICRVDQVETDQFIHKVKHPTFNLFK